MLFRMPRVFSLLAIGFLFLQPVLARAQFLVDESEEKAPVDPDEAVEPEAVVVSLGWSAMVKDEVPPPESSSTASHGNYTFARLLQRISLRILKHFPPLSRSSHFVSLKLKTISIISVIFT